MSSAIRFGGVDEFLFVNVLAFDVRLDAGAGHRGASFDLLADAEVGQESFDLSAKVGGGLEGEHCVVCVVVVLFF